MHVAVRGQLCGVALLPPPFMWVPAARLASKCLWPLSRLSNPGLYFVAMPLLRVEFGKIENANGGAQGMVYWVKVLGIQPGSNLRSDPQNPQKARCGVCLHPYSQVLEAETELPRSQ